MSDVEVKYGDDAAGTASRLLAAARELELSTSVVRTTSDNVFLVPEEVADQAGVSFDVVDGDEKAPEDVQGADDSDADGGDGSEDQDDALEVPAGSLDDRVAWVAEADDQSEATKRANAVYTHERESGADEAALDDLKPKLHTAVYGEDDQQGDGEGFDASGLKGKSLEAALKERGLKSEGTADEKRARVAEYENTKE